MIPVFDVSRAIGWIKTAGFETIKWMALRGLILAVVGTLIPIAIYRGWLLITEKIMTYTSTQMTGDFWSGTFVELTGLAGWLSTNLQFQACFTILATAMSFKLILRILRI